MIIYSDLRINDYQQTILDNEKGFRGGAASRGTFRCANPDCRGDCFYRHGTYERYFISISEDAFDMDMATEKDDSLSIFNGMITRRLSVLRVRCVNCGQTHAILPNDVVPYHSFSLLLQLMILKQIYKNIHSPNQNKGIHQTEFLSWSFLNALLQTFQNYRSRMLHILRIQSIYSKEVSPSDQDLLQLYLSSETHACSRFRQVFSSQLFLSRRSTVSCPICIMIHE